MPYDRRPGLVQIRVEGHLGATVLSAFPSLTAEHQVRQTVLIGLLDRSALYGALSQMEMLGLDLVEVTRSDPPGGPVEPGTGTRHDGRATSR